MSLLCDCKKRLTTFPISDFCMPLWQAYKKQVTKFWTPEELDFKSDLSEWKTLEEDEQKFLLHILAFFAISDSVVLENLVSNFCNELDNPEVVAFYTFQAMMENMHAETYSILLDLFCTDKDQKQKLFDAVETLPSVAAKVNFAKHWMDPTTPYEQRLVAFACVEGILFSGSFCAIYWLKHFKQKCPGLTLSNEFIARDEGMHCEFAVLLYTKYTKKKDKLSSETLREIVLSAVKVEKYFILSALPRKLTGMNKDLMSSYIEFVADRLFQQLCDETLYEHKVKNPFAWMEQISLQGKTNFFEKRVSEYNKAGVGDEEEDTFDFDMSTLS
jgi:ribonucleotide reductase beta subunit family protein with ferritin-like domain